MANVPSSLAPLCIGRRCHAVVFRCFHDRWSVANMYVRYVHNNPDPTIIAASDVTNVLPVTSLFFYVGISTLLRNRGRLVIFRPPLNLPMTAAARCVSTPVTITPPTSPPARSGRRDWYLSYTSQPAGRLDRRDRLHCFCLPPA